MALWGIKEHYAVPEKLITLIKKTYDHSTYIVVLCGFLSELFDILTGVGQGCLLSPMLFLLVVDWIKKSRKRLGARWTLTTLLEDLDFADDLTMMLHILTDIQKKVDRLAAISMKAGLSVNRNKTEVMRVNNRCEV